MKLNRRRAGAAAGAMVMSAAIIREEIYEAKSSPRWGGGYECSDDGCPSLVSFLELVWLP